MKYFTADLHLGHRNIIKYCNRPFANLEEMNDTLILNINKRVKRVDSLYILGDFCFGGNDAVAEYRGRINCSDVHLILGNHDKNIPEELFSSVSNFKEIIVKHGRRNHYITLCHYAMRVWPRYLKGSFMLYGHSHGKLTDDENVLSFDCGVDNNNYSPYSMDDVIRVMKKKKYWRHK